MEWIVGLYVAVGLFKAWGKLLSDASDKPMWMYTEKNPIRWALYFVAYVAIWPFAKG